MSNITGEEGSFSSGNTGEEVQQLLHQGKQQQHNQFHGSLPSDSAPSLPAAKKKRNLPGTPDPTAEVVALSPTTLMATNRFVCEICNKGFQRDQNLQLHRRGHNLPWKLRQRTSTEVRKRVYICPEPSCVHHNPARALGDLTGIKKHFSRKHGEKKWKCDKCSKKYAVQSDWKAHQKTCGTREYKCDCGTIFSRRDSFITHRAFCDALAEENSKVNQGLMNSMGSNLQAQMPHELLSSMPNNTSVAMSDFNNNYDNKSPLKSLPPDLVPFKPMNMAGGMFSTSSGTLFGSPRNNVPSSSSGLQLSSNTPSSFNGTGQVSGTAHMSATALLQKAAQMGATASNGINSPMMQKSFVSSMAGPMMQSPNNSSYENFQTQPDQTTMVGINTGGGGVYGNSQMLQKGPQEGAQMFGSGPANSPTMNDMGMFSEMLMGNDHQSHAGFMKNMGNQDNDSPMGWNPTGPSRFGGISGPAGVGSGASGVGSGGGNDMLTVDFLGIGGGSRPPIVHEQQQRMQMANPFQQQLSHGDSDMEKPIWDV